MGMPKTTEEWLELIYDIAVGYDGCETVNSLKELVDEMKEHAINARKSLLKTNKENLLFQAARQILQNQCPKHQEYYFCKKYIGEDEEPRCMECWDNYLFAIVNGRVSE